MNRAEGNDQLRLGVLWLLSICLAMFITIMIVLVVDILMGDIAAIVLSIVIAVGLIVFGLWMLVRSISNLFIRHSQNTIQGFVMAQAADDRGEVMRQAVQLAKGTTQLDVRAAQMAQRMNDQLKQLTGSVQVQSPVKRNADLDDWFNFSDSDFIEAD